MTKCPFGGGVGDPDFELDNEVDVTADDDEGCEPHDTSEDCLGVDAVPGRFFSLSGYDPNVLRVWVKSVLEKRLKEEVVLICDDFVGEMETAAPKWFMEIPFTYSSDSPRPAPLVEWAIHNGEKIAFPTMNVVKEMRPKFGNNVVDVPVFMMIVHWGKFTDNQFFCRARDKDTLLVAALANSRQALPYDVSAFPVNALKWAESAKRFFSSDLREKFAKHNVPQQMGVVLSGPPGCGKTMFLRHLSATLGMEVEHYTPARLMSMSKRGNQLPETGMIVFDDVEELLQERQTGESTSILPWLLLQTDARDVWVSRLLVMVTNHQDKLDDALLRPGRFDSSLKFEIPTQEQMLAALKFHMADCFDATVANDVVEKIMKMETRTLAHVSYLCRIVYSGFVASWDEALESLKKYSAYSGVKDGARSLKPGLGFGRHEEYR
jgi:hypothetical protein